MLQLISSGYKKSLEDYAAKHLSNFDMPAYDKLRDAWRAIRLKRQAGRNAAADLLEMENISPG